MNEREEKKRKNAVALSYDTSTDEAPRVVATGKGFVAEKIIAEAEKNHIPIQHDASLVELLGQLTINEKIPQELYGVVAEIFAFIYRIDQGVTLPKKDK
ncbi:EscU/YscU/HrcU family type III secretion system export apparatus switch protein [Priestia koreensis]|uniref:EscU/YscU/HrcU family type III secretion system export apparatus switch protein n=1 Tax=Priestia koreensis TaxID=284581 RepID=UPI001F5A5761|nr:EscU/YscU/HrcU family type III secretion system export apparatus switch protein [Priestia koreensis]MCM3003789.1 EscU/YscU/HrcU family type III secretion system export apparatus switch protein [Priestia koreensis]UNL83895.1 EscU/YscU/HrcU family type III secretion system export apparatus switch protein [Priestia koreensis]